MRELDTNAVFSRRDFLKSAVLSGAAVFLGQNAVNSSHESFYDLLPQDREALERALGEVKTSADPGFFLQMIDHLNGNHDEFFDIVVMPNIRTYRYFPDGKDDFYRFAYTQVKQEIKGSRIDQKVLEAEEVYLLLCSNGTLSDPFEGYSNLNNVDLKQLMEGYFNIPESLNKSDWDESNPDGVYKEAVSPIGYHQVIGNEFGEIVIKHSRLIPSASPMLPGNTSANL